MKRHGVQSALHPVLIHRTLTSRFASILASAVPASLRTLWRGPVATVSLGADAPLKSRSGSLRPVDLLIPQDLVLRHRLTIPRDARRDLRSAVELFIGQKTPFTPDELLVHASEDEVPAVAGQRSYTVRAVPRAQFDAALTQSKIGRGRIARVGIVGVDSFDLAPATQLGWRWRRWSFLLPLSILVASLGMLAATDLAQRAERIAQLQTETSAALVRVRSLTAELEARSKQDAGIGEVRELLSTTPSAFSTLLAARDHLPATAQVVRIQVAGTEARFTIRSPDVLNVVQAMNAPADAGWVASIDGPITADPASGGETATILLRGIP